MFTNNLTYVLLDALAEYAANIQKASPNKAALNQVLMDISDVDPSLTDEDFIKPENSQRILDIITDKMSKTAVVRKHIKAGLETIFASASKLELLSEKLIERQKSRLKPAELMVRKGPSTSSGREFNMVRLSEYAEFRRSLAEKTIEKIEPAFERRGIDPLEVDEVEMIFDEVLEGRVQENGHIYFDGMRRRLNTYFKNNANDISGLVATHAVDVIDDIAKERRANRVRSLA